MEGMMRRIKKPAPERLEAMRKLPREILDTLTKEEVNAFLHEDTWPDSLREKLKDFLADLNKS